MSIRRPTDKKKINNESPTSHRLWVVSSAARWGQRAKHDRLNFMGKYSNEWEIPFVSAPSSSERERDRRVKIVAWRCGEKGKIILRWFFGEIIKSAVGRSKLVLKIHKTLNLNYPASMNTWMLLAISWFYTVFFAQCLHFFEKFFHTAVSTRFACYFSGLIFLHWKKLLCPQHKP